MFSQIKIHVHIASAFNSEAFSGNWCLNKIFHKCEAWAGNNEFVKPDAKEIAETGSLQAEAALISAPNENPSSSLVQIMLEQRSAE